MKNKINNLILELNSRCNNNCIYCYIPEKDRKGDKGKNNIEYFKQVLLKFRKMGVRNVDFTGGEPTLYKGLFELADFTRMAGFDNRTLVTNGRMLAYDDYCRRAIGSGINRVVLPLDGSNKEITEAITRAPGSFQQAISAIENIKSLGIELGITVVVNGLNYKDTPRIMEKSLDMGADFINIQFLLPYIKDKHVPCRKIPSEIIPKYSDSARYVKIGLDRIGNRIKTNVHFIPPCFMRGYENHLYNEMVKSDRAVVNYRGYEYNIGEHLKKGSIRTRRCEVCPHTNECPGFPRSYSKEFGISD